MGFFTGLLTLPLAPLRGVVWVAEQITEELERELYDEDSIKRELVQLELDYEEGAISEEERLEREELLMERLAVSHGSYGVEGEGLDLG